MSDLIERLKGPFNYAPRKKGELHYLKVPEGLIEDIIAALAPTLPADVAEIAKALRRAPAFSGHVEHRAADLLERQARTAEYWKAEHLAGNKRIEELQARLDYIGNPQNGAVDLAAYARGE